MVDGHQPELTRSLGRFELPVAIAALIVFRRDVLETEPVEA